MRTSPFFSSLQSAPPFFLCFQSLLLSSSFHPHPHRSARTLAGRPIINACTATARRAHIQYCPKTLHRSKSNQSSCALLVDSRSRHASLHLFAPRVACGPNLQSTLCHPSTVTALVHPRGQQPQSPYFKFSGAAHGTHSHSHHPCNDVCVHSYLIDSAWSH